MRLPDFFIIGAPKCGTTSLAAWLAEHPHVYVSPIKEPFYFSSDIAHRVVDNWSAYMSLFKDADPTHKAVGEGSVFYLFSKVAIPAIEKKISSARYIVMLRNPVDMAYALHDQQVRVLMEDISDFRTAWQLAPQRREGRQVPPGCPDPVLLDYPSWCLLGEQLERLYNYVPRERVLVLVLDDVKENPRREYLRVLNFLGVPDDGRMTFPVHNPAHELRSIPVARMIRVLTRGWGRVKQTMGIDPWQGGVGILRGLKRLNTRYRARAPLSAEMRVELESFFKEDVQRLQRLLDRDLSVWMS